jgi:hypothetical protein
MSYLFSISGAAAACCLALPMSCATDPPTSKRSCFEDIEKGQQMLSVPDHSAAKGWFTRAKKECLSDQSAAVAKLEKDIAASEARVAEQAKKREESFKPKPPNESQVPGFVEAAGKYRDQKKREKCDTDTCSEVTPSAKLTVRESTVKGTRDAFRVFTRISGERAICNQLGPSEVKRQWDSPTQIKLYCAITGGALSGLFAMLEQEKERPETYVVVFSEKWKQHDEELMKVIDH